MNRFNYLLAMPFTHSMRGPKKLLKHIALRYLASLNTHSTRVVECDVLDEQSGLSPTNLPHFSGLFNGNRPKTNHFSGKRPKSEDSTAFLALFCTPWYWRCHGTDGVFHGTDGMFHGTDGVFYGADGLFHGTDDIFHGTDGVFHGTARSAVAKAVKGVEAVVYCATDFDGGRYYTPKSYTRNRNFRTICTRNVVSCI
eukprot:2925566-Rhodomonas_salina.1